MTGCIHYRIEDRAARTPAAIVAVHGARRLTYAELDARANQLARLLRHQGADRGRFVALSCDFGFALLVAMLGILKTGAAYVPIAPETPRPRTDAILAQIDCAALVTQRHLGFDGVAVRHLVTLDERWSAIADLDRSAFEPASDADDVAYCIFTSGSTGTPKGALNTHKGLDNLCAWYAGDASGGGPTARTMVTSSIAFDLTQKNLLEPMASGGLLIFGGGRVGDTAGMAAAIDRHRPTRVNCAPSAFELFENVLLAAPLRIVVLGGEPIPPRLARAITGRGIALMNSYGPTECADVATYHVATAPTEAVLPLGGPIPNVAVHILDDAMQLVVGAGVGELCIEGMGVGLGYIGQPELTAARFVRVPIDGRKVALYRTGDMVRRTADGELHYVERRDRQLKIRGNRVELGEIEACLAGHAAVRACAITDFQDDGGDTRIAALVVAPVLSETSVLVRHLIDRLPAYMLPALWRIVDALPLNGSGKVDRIAIRELALEAFQHQARNSPPTEAEASSTERNLVEIWSAALGRGSVRPDDDFFALGGDSLAALHISMAVHERWGRRLTIDQIHTLRTIRALAPVVEAAEAADDAPTRRPPGTRDDVFVPTTDQLADLHETGDATASLQYIGFGLVLRGRFELDRFTRAVSEVIDRQEALRTLFERDRDGALVGRIVERPAWTPECLDPPAKGDAQALLVETMRTGLIDPSRAPATRCILVRGSPLVTYCGFVLHHAVADAWSMSVLTRDIAESYNWPAGHETGPARRYIDAASSDDEREPHLRYWRTQLADLPAQTLPFGVTATPSAIDAGHIDLAIGAERAEAIRRCCAVHGTTPYAVILTALFFALHRAGCGEDLHVRSPSSNRAGRSLESVIGPFAARLMIRASVTAASDPARLLGDVADRVREAHRHVGLAAALFARCMPPRPPGATGPRFPISYNHHSYPPHPHRWGELALSPIENDFARIRGALALHSWPAHDGAMRCMLAYNLSVFDARQAETFATLLRSAISEIVACDRISDTSIEAGGASA